MATTTKKKVAAKASRYDELRKMLEDRRRELLNSVHEKIRDARAEGNWACAPHRFPEVIGMVADGRIVLEPFIEHRPLSRIDETFADLAAHRLHRRAVLAPDFA